ncbi:F-box and leucine-rich repeat protein 13 isoform X28 [Callithrix jacchus]|uniref:dynein regulatory complex subunit 6 isoform X19 n=1 Tax=Callithrix jacchus TaxID=9483 RepID=UPI0023DD477A|nr:dynein regulatory complex subunit 6 isoform X19 [Callithrix jacchus]
MASLRNANPRLKNYFKENYIPQVCEALLCGILVTCPEDPLRFLEGMIMVIIKSGLQNLLWDTCIAPSMKPNIRRLSETYLEQLFELDDQLMTPELMIKACSFYTGHLVKTHFCTWRDITHKNENVALADKMNRAVTCYDFRLQKSVFHHWHSYMEDQKEKLKNMVLRIQRIIYCHKLTIILTKWRNKARCKNKKKEDELMSKHELQLKKWRNRLLLKGASAEKSNFPEQSSSEVCLVDETLECDISQLPERAILQIFFYLSLKDVLICGQVNHAWMLMTQLSSLWNAIDFSTVKHAIPDKYIVSTLQRWHLNVLRLNFRGCLLRPKTFRSAKSSKNIYTGHYESLMPSLGPNCCRLLVWNYISPDAVPKIHRQAGCHCRNLQELNVSDCPTFTDESMRHISEGCPGVLYLNLSNTTITNRTMRLLPRHFHNLQNLSLAYCRRFTDKGLQYLNLGNGCHKLIYLDLSGCTQDLNVLSRHKKLKELSVSACYRITDDGIQAFCKNSLILECLDVSYCSQLSDMIIKALAIYCINLTSLSIAGCPKITDSVMEMLSAKCHYLHILDISGCVLLTDQILDDLQIGCKQLRILRMQYCTNISKNAAERMSSKVQQQEYNSNDPPRWFRYDREGNPLTQPENITSSKGHLELTVEKSTYSSEEEAV